MYRHLLVPVDATDLSIEVVVGAVDFAASAGARVTFLHASPDRAESRFRADIRDEAGRVICTATLVLAYGGA